MEADAVYEKMEELCRGIGRTGRWRRRPVIGSLLSLPQFHQDAINGRTIHSGTQTASIPACICSSRDVFNTYRSRKFRDLHRYQLHAFARPGCGNPSNDLHYRSIVSGMY
eukprot:310276-Chlamydomonas_euryale.AAC.5